MKCIFAKIFSQRIDTLLYYDFRLFVSLSANYSSVHSVSTLFSEPLCLLHSREISRTIWHCARTIALEIDKFFYPHNFFLQFLNLSFFSSLNFFTYLYILLYILISLQYLSLISLSSWIICYHYQYYFYQTGLTKRIGGKIFDWTRMQQFVQSLVRRPRHASPVFELHGYVRVCFWLLKKKKKKRKKKEINPAFRRNDRWKRDTVHDRRCSMSRQQLRRCTLANWSVDAGRLVTAGSSLLLFRHVLTPRVPSPNPLSLSLVLSPSTTHLHGFPAS